MHQNNYESVHTRPWTCLYPVLNLLPMKPAMMVAKRGVLNLELILAIDRKMSPSEAMAYRTRGSGSMPPRRLVDSPNRAPIVTIHLATGHPTWWGKEWVPDQVRPHQEWAGGIKCTPISHNGWLHQKRAGRTGNLYYKTHLFPPTRFGVAAP